MATLVGVTAVATARAQTTDASLLGTVRDRAGATLAGVVVTARNVATGGQWTVSSSSTGRFAFL